MPQLRDAIHVETEKAMISKIKAWEVQLLADEGYNYVWLVSYTVSHYLSSVNVLFLL